MGCAHHLAGASDDALKHRRQIQRGRDLTTDFSQRRHFIRSALRVLEQPGILNGDRRLTGQPGQENQIGLREDRFLDPPPDGHDTQDLVLQQQWGRHELLAFAFRRRSRDVHGARVKGYVVYDLGHAVLGDAPDDPRPEFGRHRLDLVGDVAVGDDRPECLAVGLDHEDCTRIPKERFARLSGDAFEHG